MTRILGLWGQYLTYLKKVAQIDIYTKTDAKPVGNFWENDQRPEF